MSAIVRTSSTRIHTVLSRAKIFLLLAACWVCWTLPTSPAQAQAPSAYAPIQVIGGQGGEAFEQLWGVKGKSLKKLGVWGVDFTIKAIKVTLSDDTTQTFGTPAGTYQEFVFEANEQISKLSLWGNGAGTRSGWIEFTTDKGRVFSHGMTEWGKKQEYPIDVGSGIWAGIKGRAGADIDSLGFVFFNPIAESSLIDVKYPTLNRVKVNLQPEELDSFKDQNTTKRQTTKWEFAGKETREENRTWAVGGGVELSASVTVSAGIPVIGKGEVTTGLKLTATASHAWGEKKTRELSWKVSGKLKPGQTVSLKAITRKAVIDIPFKGTMKIKLKNGAKFSYEVKGKYKGVNYTDVTVTTKGSK